MTVDLYDRIIEAIHGQVEFRGPSGEKITGLGPHAWAPKAKEDGCVAGWQIIALVVFVFGVPAREISAEDERRIVVDWRAALLDAIRTGALKPRDAVTFLPRQGSVDDVEWVLPLEEADAFMASMGHSLKVSDLINELADESPDPWRPWAPSPPPDTPSVRTMGERERNAYLRLVGAMLELLKSPRPGRDDDKSIIKELIANYGEMDGISESGLSRKFAEAKRLLSK